MIKVAEIFLVSKSGTFIMQQRDDIQGIANPGQITAFGGAIDSDDESPRLAAKREGEEETNLIVDADDLEDFGMTRKTKQDHGEDSEVYWFVLRDVDTDGLEIYEGQGYVEIQPDADLDQFDMSLAAKQFIMNNRDKLTLGTD